MTVPTSRRERKKTRTRRELISAARELISEKGVEELRLVDITERADVANGTFYIHFAGKDEIIDAVVTEVLGPIADAIGDFSEYAEDPAIAVAVAVRELLRLFDVDPELARILVRLDHADARFERMTRDYAHPVIVSAIKSGRFRYTGDDVGLLVRITLGTVFTALQARIDSDDDVDFRVAATLVLQLMGLDYDEAVVIALSDLPEIAAPALASGGNGRPST